MRSAAAGTAAAVPIPVVFDLLGYRFEAGPFVVSLTMVLITRLCVYLNTKGRRQVALDIAVTALCCVVAVLWTQAHSLSLLPAGVSAIGIAGIGYGIIGMGKSQVALALRDALGALARGLAASPPPTDGHDKAD